MKQEILYFYLTLLRHGETTENKNQVIQGHLDTDLSAVGLEQAKNIRTLINQSKPDIIISSDLKRARYTAYEVTDPSVVELESRIRERNFGSLTGRPRSEVQQFTEINFKRGYECDGWRNIGGECTHEMASRTHNFLLDLCSRLIETSMKHTNVLRQDPFPIIGSSDLSPMGKLICKSFDVFPNENTKAAESPISTYAGHVLIVGHGGWIRQFLRLLAFHSKYKQNFPKQCVNSVMNNCGICQVGVAFDICSLEAYRKCPQYERGVSMSPLPVFGNIMTHSETSSVKNSIQCSYIHLANPSLPIMTVCYQFNATKSLFEKHERLQHDPHYLTIPTHETCLQEERIPQDDGDEYAGYPLNK
ncbi:phosphoglycerate mutase [Schistosoma mansoni]|uniref:Fructose-2,6-bisphosphatase TIGAR n=2 Tax=Schistosoma mansoni TaxID=6183 RepID=G4VRA6_SCHMA|nr:phosphoglycerate mutase [Schistosoma mansoni]|eukprot:XP_018655259.1 phosphoglycerate mutase [Schistosoma mansoni]